MCPKAKVACLTILQDAEASFWDREEAKAYLESEAVVAIGWKRGKPFLWRVECGDVTVTTTDPMRVYCDWLRKALASA